MWPVGVWGPGKADSGWAQQVAGCVSIATVKEEEAVDLGGANRKGRDGSRRKERKEKIM